MIFQPKIHPIWARYLNMHSFESYLTYVSCRNHWYHLESPSTLIEVDWHHENIFFCIRKNRNLTVLNMKSYFQDASKNEVRYKTIFCTLKQVSFKQHKSQTQPSALLIDATLALGIPSRRETCHALDVCVEPQRPLAPLCKRPGAALWLDRSRSRLVFAQSAPVSISRLSSVSLSHKEQMLDAFPTFRMPHLRLMKYWGRALFVCLASAKSPPADGDTVEVGREKTSGVEKDVDFLLSFQRKKFEARRLYS